MSIKNNVKYDIEVNEIWTNIKIMKLVIVEEELFAFQRLLYKCCDPLFNWPFAYLEYWNWTKFQNKAISLNALFNSFNCSLIFISDCKMVMLILIFYILLYKECFVLLNNNIQYSLAKYNVVVEQYCKKYVVLTFLWQPIEIVKSVSLQVSIIAHKNLASIAV